MDDKKACDTKAKEPRDGKIGETDDGGTAAGQQGAEEHDWDAMTARLAALEEQVQGLAALEEQVQGLAAAMATISAAADDKDGKLDADLPDDEYGEALDLDDEDLAGMLGL